MEFVKLVKAYLVTLAALAMGIWEGNAVHATGCMKQLKLLWLRAEEMNKQGELSDIVEGLLEPALMFPVFKPSSPDHQAKLVMALAERFFVSGEIDDGYKLLVYKKGIAVAMENFLVVSGGSAVAPIMDVVWEVEVAYKKMEIDPDVAAAVAQEILCVQPQPRGMV